MVKSFAIGYTVRDVAKGSWIDESTVTLPKAPPRTPASGDQSAGAAAAAEDYTL